MTLLSALELAGSYPENILIEALEHENKKFSVWVYMLRDGDIHKLMMNSEAVFDTKKIAEETLHNLAKEVKEKYGGH